VESHEPHTPQTKFCPCCKTEKSIFDFHSKGHRHESVCKICSNARKKKKRIQRKTKERRKRQKGHTLLLGDVEVVGNLTEKVIEEFGSMYGNLILEVLNESK
jgi:predicted sulfurtransferase